MGELLRARRATVSETRDALSTGGVTLAVPVFSGPEGPEVATGLAELAVDVPPTTVDPELCVQRGFTGKRGQSLVVSLPGSSPIVYVGCGERATLDREVLRRAGASAIRSAAEAPAVVFVLPSPGEADPDTDVAGAAQAVVEGATLAAYRFERFRTEEQPKHPEDFAVLGAEGFHEAVDSGVQRAVLVARAVCFARDLVNEPPSGLTPRRFGEIALEELGSRPGLRVEVWDEERIRAERLGALLGVARGSAEPPRLVTATYEPSSSDPTGGPVPHVVLVGKGITFDSGGLSLKTADGMTTMKTDMSGAAAVLAAISVCGELGVKIRVTAIAPITENMPGGRATKPGDVLVTRDGQTIEVLNTDAEGRLVLADGLTLARELEPDAILDLATLTGACVVALGASIAGVFGNNEALIATVREASQRAGELTWPLPLPEEYRDHIDSEIADMKNVGKAGQAGAISAALLLSRFVGAVPWVHLDIAGPARAAEESGYRRKGGTGFGVRTLIELLERWVEEASS
jgi:leucyl aminopeptidase